jgi:RNA 3'-phosphate cyclase
LDKFLEIDGAGPGLQGYEAGGQILRIALALSPILKRSFKMSNIRSGRPKPGLQPQHLTGVKAVAEITGAEVAGTSVGSQEIVFNPKAIKGGEYTFDTGTAGSITLLAQSILPLLLFAREESHIILRGGTHVQWSPTIDYYVNVFLPIVRRFGAEAEVKVNKYGWYPKGGGEIEISIRPSQLTATELIERGKQLSIEGVCALSNLREDIMERETKGVHELLPEANMQHIPSPAASPGTAVTIFARYENTVLGAEALGKIGKSAEEVGREAAQRLKDELSNKAALDSHMTDQVLVFMALANGKSTITVPTFTPHAKTCAWLIPMFTNIPFDISDNTISVAGIRKGLNK